jgi:molecular chaperone HtpG
LQNTTISTEKCKANIEVFVDTNSLVSAKVTNIFIDEQSINGELVLVQNHGTLQGLRNYFGLSAIPVAGSYNLGGVANLSFLQPTAGREAISRDSINIVNQIIALVEEKVTLVIAETPHADNNVHFMQHILNIKRIELAGNVTIEVYPSKEKMPLAHEKEYQGPDQSYYYTGRDSSTIAQFSSSGLRLLLLAQSNPRRKVQLRYIREHLKVQEIPDTVRIDKVYAPSELTMDEIALKIRITTCLNEDYLIPDVEVQFANISHNVNIQSKVEGEKLQVFISRGCSPILPVLEVYSTSYDIFGPFVKDFVRNHVFSHIESFIPSSKRQGVDALRRILAEKRELYRYEWSEIGEMEPLISDFMTGKIGFGEVLKKSHSIGRSQTQIVRSNQIGGVEDEIPDLASSPTSASDEIQEIFGPSPSLLRTDATTKMKVLTTEKPYSQLNNFRVFIALSDRVLKREYDFFLQPHSTKIIWGSHRIIYIFTHASNLLTLYYNIELKERMADDTVGGGSFRTSTIVMKNRIFIPIPDKFNSFFQISEGTKEFYVTYDAIGE